MHVLAALALLASTAPPPAPGVLVTQPNVVEICSVATGGCRQVLAAALDPTAAASQVAFVDEATGALTQPTLEQLEELDGPLSVVEETRIGAVVETVRLANGAVVAAPRGGFLVELRATVAADPATGAAIEGADGAAAAATPAASAPASANSEATNPAAATTAAATVPAKEQRP